MNFGVISVRLSKVVLAAGIAFFAFLVTLSNIVDYGTNWEFVQHVLEMDTIFPDSTLRSRAVTDPTIQRAAYLAIIVTEGLTCLVFLVAAALMVWNLRAPRDEFIRAKSFVAIGVVLAFGLWFVGFMTIGGEWFAMWQSKVWDGQSAAYRFDLTIVGVAIYIFLDTDGDYEPR